MEYRPHQKLGSSLELSLQYEGRKAGDANIVIQKGLPCGRYYNGAGCYRPLGAIKDGLRRFSGRKIKKSGAKVPDPL